MISRIGEPDRPDRNAQYRILVVEDDAPVRDLLSDALTEAGYEVYAASCRAELFDLIERHKVDLITLDLGLGSEEGLDIAREVRAKSNVPIIMITGRAQPVDRVVGLENGADDYITKPFLVREVLIRVATILARYRRPLPEASDEKPANLSIHFDHCWFDYKRRLLCHNDGTEIALTETEFEILALFLANPARILSRDDIWMALRGNERDPLDRTLDGHIARLRAKLEGETGETRLIKSVRGVGYVFVGDVGPDGDAPLAMARSTASAISDKE